jgi:hypothetical protein
MKKKSFQERFWSRVKKNKGNGCWTWTGSCHTNWGYGQVRVENRKTKMVHRISWEMENGPIPEGMKVLHKCDNPPCIRPSHLFLGTQSDNMQDCSRKSRLVMPQSRGLNRFNASKTECKLGHAFDENNTYIYQGERQCRICRRAARLRSLAKAA